MLIRPHLQKEETGTGIHSAVVCATGSTVVFDSRTHLVSRYEVVHVNPPLITEYSYSQSSSSLKEVDVDFSKCRVWPGAKGGDCNRSFVRHT